MKKFPPKKILAAFFASLCANIFAAAPDVSYISPNNDGVQDNLTVPLSIKDKRYISEWSFIVEDSRGNIVRVIGNKQALPEDMSVKNFFKALVTPKQGVAVPSSVTWNGILDSGEIARDGEYTYYVTAIDDNGNASKSPVYKVVVDNTPPAVTLQQPRESDKFFGEGSKAQLGIVQSGSVEDKWTGVVRNAAGQTVRTFVWSSSSPQNAAWDGRGDDGIPVPDGVYSYQISSSDRAGNKSAPASITNIIYSAERPATNIAINGGRYFSPNGDGVQDTMAFDVTIPAPESGNRLTRWQIAIQDKNGAAKKTFSGVSDPPKTLFFDGAGDSGAVLAEGEYQAVVTAQYLNGFEPLPARSPVFVLDVTPPKITLGLGGTVFSPDGDGKLDTIAVRQTASASGSPVADWRGEIRDANNRTVKTYSFGSRPTDFAWNGQDDSGKLCDDGFYTYRLSASDLAGNRAESVTQRFELNTGTTEVILTARPEAFSPNGDGVQDSVTFTPVVKSRSPVTDYSLTVKNAKGETVFSQEGRGALPSSLSWNGRDASGSVLPDGLYTAQIRAVSENGSESTAATGQFELDTVAPSVRVSTTYLVFSPDGDSEKDTLPLWITTSREDKWTGTFTALTGNARGKVVRTMTWENANVPSFSWDGTDDAGNTVPDGTYRFTLAATDRAGNKAQSDTQGIVVDARPTRAWVTAELEAFSPNGSDAVKNQRFTFTVSLNEGIEGWSFVIVNEKRTSVRVWSGASADGKPAPSIPATLAWDGANDAGKIAEGKFTGMLLISYIKGNQVRAETSPFTLSVTPPRLTAQTAPRYFSPDNDGNDDDLFITLRVQDLAPLASWSFVVRDPYSGKEFWRVDGKSTINERIVWDGRGNNGELVQSAMDYPYTFSATNALGMSSSVDGIISVDVLVFRVGDVLKLQIPAIIFAANRGDFEGLDRKTTDNNIRVLRRIAEILNKFKEYSVRVEGHANNTTGTEAEETSSAGGNIPLVPLSQSRAEYVKKLLVEYRVDAKRLSTVGVGGRQRIVPLSDRDNWWKNRRVEFILEK